MYRYYYDNVTASMAPHSVLEETGAAYEAIRVDITAPRPAGYEAKQPLSRVPVLEDGDLVVFESAAIMMHLSDRHPETELAPPVGDRLRAHFYQWLVFYPAHIHASTKFHNYAHRYTTDEACIPSVRAKAVETVDELFGVLDGRMGAGPWVLGERFSACDHALHMYCTWIEQDNNFAPLPTYPNLAGFVARARERPAIRRMLEIHGVL